MAISTKQLREVLKTICQDLPRPRLKDLINCGTSNPDEIRFLAKFINNNYSTEEILEAFNNNLKIYTNIFKKETNNGCN